MVVAKLSVMWGDGSHNNSSHSLQWVYQKDAIRVGRNQHRRQVRPQVSNIHYTTICEDEI